MHATSQTSRPRTEHACDVGGCGRRLFVDLTTSMLRGQDRPVAAGRFEAEVARRLLLRPTLNPLPVAFDEDGTMFALSEQAVDVILASAARGPAMRARLRRADPPAADSARPADAAPPGVRRAGALRLAGAAARAVARNGVRMLPGAVREDVRAILIHGRRIVRTLVDGRLREPPPRLEAEPHPQPPAPVLPPLSAVVHPRAGDVLWTGAPQDGFAPLRLIGDMARYRGMKVAAAFLGQARLAASVDVPPDGAAAVLDAAAIDLLRVASRVVAVSEPGRDDLVAFAAAAGIAPPPVEVVRPGTTLATVEPGPLPAVIASGAGGPRRFALVVGTVGAQQNQPFLVRAWEALAADPDFALDLVIVGEAAAGASEIARRIEDSPLFGARITWIEHCPDDILAALFRAADAVLDPGFADGELFAITEALAFGRPLVASGVGAARGLPPDAATLLDPQDDQAWCEVLRGIGRAARAPVAPPGAPDWDSCAEAVARDLAVLLSQPIER